MRPPRFEGMSIDLLINLIIALLICGFIYWVWLKIRPLLPIAEPFGSIVDILIIVVIGAIVLFWIVIPLIRALAHANLHLLH